MKNDSSLLRSQQNFSAGNTNGMNQEDMEGIYISGQNPKGLTLYICCIRKIVGSRDMVSSTQRSKCRLNKICFRDWQPGPAGLEGTGDLELEETGLNCK